MGKNEIRNIEKMKQQNIICNLQGRCLSREYFRDFNPEIDCKSCRYNANLQPLIDNRIANG